MSEPYLTDEIIRQAIQLQRLSAGEEARALAIMSELEADLERLLAGGELSEQGRREIANLLRQAREITDGHYASMGALVDMNELILVVADKTVAAMAESFPGATVPTPERLASLTRDVLIEGSPASAWWAKQADDTAFKFAAEVRAGVIEGATNEQITARIFGRGDEAGFFPASRRAVRALVHSSIMTAANRARLETFKKNSRFAAGVEVLETLDSHTCIQCMAYGGTKWDFDGKALDEATVATGLQFRLPQYHFGCRCTITPVPKGLDSIFPGIDAKIAAGRQRASSDGPIADTNFAGFLARQSPEWVERALGKARADLWRAGKITLTDLVSGSGRPLTLEQIRGRRSNAT